MINEKIKNVNKIIIAELVDESNIKNTVNYFIWKNNKQYRVINILTIKEEITNVVKIFFNADYDSNIIGMFYPQLFQFFNEN
ncbi:MAG: hypothetical protein ACK5HL_04700 [Bacilli bacterium]